VARLLVAAKADTEKADLDNKTPLICTARQRHTEVAGLLVAAKTDTKKANPDGDTPIWALHGTSDATIGAAFCIVAMRPASC
jgi:ankyrin repeat protein